MTSDGANAGEVSVSAANRLAHEIRRLRESCKLSQRQLATKIGYTRQYISLAEREDRPPASQELVRAIDQALQANGALVALREDARIEQRKLRRGNADDVQVPPGVTLDALLGEEGTTNRRQLIALAAAVTFGAALDQPAALIIAEADQVKVPETVRIGDVHELGNAVDVLEAWDHQAGGGAVRHHILGALRWGTGLMDGSCTPAVRSALASTVARLADLAAWATFDAGFHGQARKLFMLGLQAAYESGDLGIRAHVATGLARQEIHMGNAESALDLVQLAYTAADELTPNAVSMLHAVKSLAYAKKPDQDLCRRFAQQALDTYRPELIDDDPAWIRFFTPAKLDGDTANALFDLLIANSPLLGQGQAIKSMSRARADLVEKLSATVSGYPDSRARSKSMAAARLATLLYLEGEAQEANAAARIAISLAGDVRSARLGSDLRVLARATGATRKDEGAQVIRGRANVLAAAMM